MSKEEETNWQFSDFKRTTTVDKEGDTTYVNIESSWSIVKPSIMMSNFCRHNIKPNNDTPN